MDDGLLGPFQRLEEQSGGVLGVAALHLETGRMVGFRAKERFPMMSVAEFPVAVRVLGLMEAGVLPFRKMVRVEREQYSLGYSPLRDKYPDGFVTTVGDLLEASVKASDNTAHDALLEMAGGAAVVNPPIEKLLAGGIHIDRSERQQIEDLAALGMGAYVADGRDTATPEAMAFLLSAIHAGKLLHPASIERLKRWMRETPTGAKRIKALLPESAEVWHKTGTGGDRDGVNLCTNDVGVFKLADGRGHVALAAFVRTSKAGLEAREGAIAGAAKLMYDWFMAQPAK